MFFLVSNGKQGTQPRHRFPSIGKKGHLLFEVVCSSPPDRKSKKGEATHWVSENIKQVMLHIVRKRSGSSFRLLVRVFFSPNFFGCHVVFPKGKLLFLLQSPATFTFCGWTKYDENHFAPTKKLWNHGCKVAQDFVHPQYLHCC